MSTPTANTIVTTTTTTTPPGLNIGLIVGGVLLVLLAMILIAAAVYFIKRRRNAVPYGPPTAANGLGVMNRGTNAVPRTNINLNAGRITA
jgi:hypothetical protein